METKKIEINGRTIAIPSYYQQVDSAPEDPEGSTPLYAPLEKQRKINGLQFHTGLRKVARSIDRTAFALYTLIILDMSKKISNTSC